MLLFNKIKKAAAATAAAGAIGGALLTGIPKDKPAPVQEPVAIQEPVSKQEPAPKQASVKAEPTKNVSPELPDNLDELPVAEKKKKFFDVIVPLVRNENNRIRKNREKLLSIIKKGKVSKEEKKWLSDLMKKYKTDNLETLLKRVDIIPTSLVVAQAAIESGWGTSRFAKQGNSLFGQRDYSGGGIKPKGATGFTVAKFDNIADSIKSYMQNLNTHKAYKGLRDRRKDMRDSGEEINSLNIIPALSKYSERGQAYIRDLASIIKSNDLKKFDG